MGKTDKTAETMPLWKQMILAIVLGCAVGLALSPHSGALLPEDTALAIAEWLYLPGGLFLALIKMIVIPLVVCSITLAITDSPSLAHLRDTGLKVGFYFVCTTTLAVMIGITLVGLINPGQYIEPAQLLTEDALSRGAALPVVESRPSLPSMLIGLLPTNPAKAVVDYSMLHIVVASILSGIALLSIGAKKAKPINSAPKPIQMACWTPAINKPFPKKPKSNPRPP